MVRRSICLWGLFSAKMNNDHCHFSIWAGNVKCVVLGVRVALEYLYQHKIKTSESRSGKWLFYKLNAAR